MRKMKSKKILVSYDLNLVLEFGFRKIIVEKTMGGEAGLKFH
jgi:hypothetical protein